MTDGNTASEVLAGPDAAEMQKQIAELTARLAKYEEDRIARPDFGGEVPSYRLKNPCFLEDDVMHEEGEEIGYWGHPNMEMVPLNDAAKARMQQWIEALTEGARQVAELHGRPFLGFINDKGHMIAQAQQDARRAAAKVEIVTPALTSKPPPMPHLETEQQKARAGRPSRKNLVASSIPAPRQAKPEATPMKIIGSQMG